jgi:hypothetical protein
MVLNVFQDTIKAYKTMHVWVQSANGMGDRWFENEMEMIDEEV